MTGGMLHPARIESKYILARLLASENIFVRHAKVKTASFNVVTRVLTLPIWMEMSDDIYNLLVAHEVGHAIYTDRSEYPDAGKLIDPKRPTLAQAYVNIVEDPRIERLIKSRYPGLAGSFARGYREFLQRDLFGTSGSPVSGRCLIDRINLFFKVGSVLKVPFTPEEMVLVEKVRSTITFQDVVGVAREIYLWAEKHETKREPQPFDCTESQDECKANDQNGDSGDGEEDHDAASVEPPEASEDGGPDESPDGACGDTGDDPATDTTRCPGDSEPGDGEPNDPAAVNMPGDGLAAPPFPESQRQFDCGLQNLVDEDAPDVVYVKVPKPDLKKIVVDYKIVHRNIRQQLNADRKGLENIRLAKAKARFAAFRVETRSKVNHIYKEFMLRKRAEEERRTRTTKIGTLNTLKLHAYRYDDDLFNTTEIFPEGKNHGLLIVVDWSGSMRSSMRGTIEQLINLVLFCRKASIPFEVYSVTTGSSNAFTTGPGDLHFSEEFQMRNYFSSRMSAQEFTDACLNVFAMMNHEGFEAVTSEDQLAGCTPLVEAIVTATEIVPLFRQRTGAQIVNVVFLTDGDANTVGSYSDGMEFHNMGDRSIFILEDRRTHKQYQFDRQSLTPTMFQMLRDRQQINVIGFYVLPEDASMGFRLRKFFPDQASMETGLQEMQRNGFTISTDWGYNELYILFGGSKLQVLKAESNDGQAAADSTGFERFKAERSSIMKDRVMLDRFVSLIA
jgi:hypothetical protein